MTAAAMAASPSMADPMTRSISPPIWLPLKYAPIVQGCSP